MWHCIIEHEGALLSQYIDGAVQLVLGVLREALGLLPVLPTEDRGRQKHPESQIRAGPEDHSWAGCSVVWLP